MKTKSLLTSGQYEATLDPRGIFNIGRRGHRKGHMQVIRGRIKAKNLEVGGLTADETTINHFASSSVKLLGDPYDITTLSTGGSLVAMMENTPLFEASSSDFVVPNTLSSNKLCLTGNSGLWCLASTVEGLLLSNNLVSQTLFSSSGVIFNNDLEVLGSSIVQNIQADSLGVSGATNLGALQASNLEVLTHTKSATGEFEDLSVSGSLVAHQLEVPGGLQTSNIEATGYGSFGTSLTSNSLLVYGSSEMGALEVQNHTTTKTLSVALTSTTGSLEVLASANVGAGVFCHELTVNNFASIHDLSVSTSASIIGTTSTQNLNVVNHATSRTLAVTENLLVGGTTDTTNIIASAHSQANTLEVITTGSFGTMLTTQDFIATNYSQTNTLEVLDSAEIQNYTKTNALEVENYEMFDHLTENTVVLAGEKSLDLGHLNNDTFVLDTIISRNPQQVMETTPKLLCRWAGANAPVIGRAVRFTGDITDFAPEENPEVGQISGAPVVEESDDADQFLGVITKIWQGPGALVPWGLGGTFRHLIVNTIAVEVVLSGVVMAEVVEPSVGMEILVSGDTWRAPSWSQQGTAVCICPSQIPGQLSTILF